LIKFTLILLYLFSIFLISIVFKKYNEDKREIMRKEARKEAEKWNWNQATLQLQNYYSDTLKEID